MIDLTEIHCMKCGYSGHYQRDCLERLPRPLDPPPLFVLFDPDGLAELLRGTR